MAVEIALRAGDFADACDGALRIEHGFVGHADHLHLAADAALWLRDADRVDEISRVLTVLPMRGRIIRGIHRLLSAGRSALVNDMDQAVSGFRELIELWKQVGMPIQTAETQALFAALVGQKMIRRLGRPPRPPISGSNPRGPIGCWSCGRLACPGPLSPPLVRPTRGPKASVAMSVEKCLWACPPDHVREVMSLPVPE